MKNFGLGIAVGVYMVLSIGILETRATAQQPLSVFLEAASKRALDVQSSEAARKEAAARREESRGDLLPRFTANGSYGHNQYEIDFTPPMSTESLVIQKEDQLQGDMRITMPIIDLSGWSAFYSTRSTAEAAKWNVALTRLNTFVQVVQQWHSLVAARALVISAQKNMDVAQKALDDANVRVRVGASEPLVLSRAKAEVARTRVLLENAKLDQELAARLLFDLTFVEPSQDEVILGGVGSEPSPIEQFMERASSMPSVKVAKREERAQESAARAAGFGLFPRIVGYFTETGTNSAGFSKSAQWVTGLAATWVFDYSRPAATRAERAALQGARVEVVRAEQQQQTAIFEAWHRVLASRAELESALAAEEASAQAANDARVRFTAGSSSQLDQIQADRDLFQAQVARIRAMANLGIARASLLLQAGLPLPK